MKGLRHQVCAQMETYLIIESHFSNIPKYLLLKAPTGWSQWQKGWGWGRQKGEEGEARGLDSYCHVTPRKGFWTKPLGEWAEQKLQAHLGIGLHRGL